MADPPEKNACDENVLQQEEIVHSEKEQKNRSAQSNQENNVTKIEKVDKTVEINVGDGDLKIEGDESKIGDDENEKKVLEDDSNVEHDKAEQLTEEVLLADSVIEQNETIEEELLLEDDLNVEHSKTDEPEVDSKMEHGTADEALEDVSLEGGSKIEQNNTEESDLLKEDSGIKPNETKDMLLRGDSTMETDESIEKALLEDVPEIEQNNENTLDDNLKIEKSLVTSDSNLEFDIKTVEKKKQCRDTTEDKLCATSDVTIEEKEEEKDSVGKEVSEVVDVKKDGEKKASTSHVEDTVSVLSLLDNEDHEGPDALGLLAEAGGRERDVEDDADADDRDCSESEEDSTHDHESEDYPEDEEEDGMPRLYYEDEENLEDDESAMETDAEDKLPGDDVEDGALTPLSDDLVNGQKPEDFGSIIINSAFSINAKEGDGIANLEIVNVASVNEDSLDLSGLDEPSTAFDESSVDMSAYEADRSDLEGEDSTMDKIVDYAGSDAIDDLSCDAEKTAQDDAKADKQEVASISTVASESDCINDNAIVDEFSVNLPKIGAVGSLSTETEKVIEEKEKSISVESKVTDETKEISVETVEPAKITAEIVEESSVRDTESLLDSLDTKDEESVLITESKSNKRKIEAITDAGDDTDEGKAVKKMDLKKIEDEEDVENEEDSVAEAMRKIEELKLELEKQLKALKSKELANAARMEIEETLAGTKEKTTSKDVEKKGDPVKDQDQPNVVEIGGSCVEDVLNEKTIKEDTEEKTDIPKVIEAIASPDITKIEVTEVKVTTKEPVEVKDDIESKKEVSEDKSEDLIEEKVDTTDLKQSTPPTPQQPIVLPEVYSLDSDDEGEPKIPSKPVEKVEVPLASKETEKPLATKQPESSRKKLPEASARKPSGIMLKSKDTLTKSKEKIKGPVCGNPRCPNRRVANLPLFPCPGYLLTLYRMRWGSKKERPKVCTNCLRLGIRHIEFLQTKIILGEEIYTAEIANAEDLVEISDSDSDSDIMDAAQGPLASYRKRPRPADAKLLTDSQKQFLAENAPAAFIAVCEKYNIGGIVAEYKERLGEEIIRMLNKTNAFSKQINNLQKSTDKLRDDFYNAFRPNTQEEPEFMIPSPYDAKPQPKIGGRRSVRNRRLVTYANLFKKSAQETEETDPVPEPPADGVTKSVVLEVDTLASLPLIGDLPDTVLQVGDEVLALRQSIFGSWAPAKIIEVWPKGTPLANGTHSLFSLVRVKFDSVSTAEGRGIKQVTGRQIAFPKPALVRYKIGTRVIALFKDRSNVQKKDAYYSGVIAEPPCAANTFRYLVFFDDGYAQYVRHLHTIAVCERSQLVWEDVHPDSRDFIRKYLESYPDRPMVRLQAGQSLKVEWNGKWWLCSVLGVDSSLALLSFLDSQPVGREEWIYRGSTRLAPLYQELQAADRRRRATPNTTNVHNKGTGVPYVEYTRNEDQAIPQPIAQLLPPSMVQNSQAQEAPEAPSTSTAASSSPAPPTLRSSGRSVAKKSTAHNQHQQQQQQQQQQQVAIPIVAPTRNPVSDHSDMKSKVVYYTPKGGLRPKKMRPHTCSRDCISKDTLPLKDLKTYNPLARPLISGWERVIMRYRGKKVIMYRAPCGRRVRTPSELHLYLRLTHSEMSVDLFDFDHQVHCLAEFVPSKCFVSKKDLSHGAEAVAVPCVNYYDHSLPEFCTYSTVRIPTQGVNLNLDEDFLCSCDCTDDCQNKETCQCWQLTMEGARFMGLPANRVGYQYKRLLEPLSTGIYECNSRCKCSKTTCLNRVVQHPLQLKLQVFKTYNRGWGIRALNDVPRGSFLCIYAGNLLTDAVANVDGLNEGDEYLAELDYIEVLERMKEGYESDAKEEDSSSDEEETQKVDKSMVDKDFRPEVNVDASSSRSQIQTRGVRKTKSTEEDKSETAKSKEKADEVVKRDVEALQRDLSIINVDDDFITISDDEEVREPLKFNAPEVGKDGKTSKYRSVRSFFGKDEACYIMDAKVQGNIGRYLNHSCAPNVFVQNVFVDTQDPRFPWVAFFALSHIRAGTELTWNYNYDVGSVPGKVMYCQCGAANCRGRLL